ncbi:hypothetical protein I316_00075 [Kwoniella heveanensis BCC8398]|uniref:Uncharacterized protein n=1 Tax=Kwoniella heveanensis BCC8398 TaxID=1296120 RepID=A0A1B9H3J6_9TREE|nr:hypothetical protein I316_00075 [Kwoniella heveanensis BCC8398]
MSAPASSTNPSSINDKESKRVWRLLRTTYKYNRPDLHDDMNEARDAEFYVENAVDTEWAKTNYESVLSAIYDKHAKHQGWPPRAASASGGTGTATEGAASTGAPGTAESDSNLATAADTALTEGGQ